MSILLYVAGAFAFAIGAAVVGYGIPINEFSFGNTLIIAGTVAMAGGMVVFSLGVVVRQLQRLADVREQGAMPRAPRPVDIAENPPVRATLPQPVSATVQPSPAPARVPFPPKPKAPVRAEAPLRAPEPPRIEPLNQPFSLPPLSGSLTPAAPSRDEESAFAAPSLPNPYEPPAFEADDLPPAKPAAPPMAEVEAHEPHHDEVEPEAKFEAEVEAKSEAEPAVEPEPELKPAAVVPPFKPELKPAIKSEPDYFDAMWPADPEPRAKAFEPKPFESKPFESKAPEPKIPAAKSFDDEPAATVFPPDPSAPEAEEEPREERPPVAILKSGVVDGMGYTLYVDGSIEAELPDGTLRFASINELRAHLEKSP